MRVLLLNHIVELGNESVDVVSTPIVFRKVLRIVFRIRISIIIVAYIAAIVETYAIEIIVSYQFTIQINQVFVGSRIPWVEIKLIVICQAQLGISDIGVLYAILIIVIGTSCRAKAIRKNGGVALHIAFVAFIDNVLCHVVCQS